MKQRPEVVLPSPRVHEVITKSGKSRLKMVRLSTTSPAFEVEDGITKGKKKKKKLQTASGSVPPPEAEVMHPADNYMEGMGRELKPGKQAKKLAKQARALAKQKALAASVAIDEQSREAWAQKRLSEMTSEPPRTIEDIIRKTAKTELPNDVREMYEEQLNDPDPRRRDAAYANLYPINEEGE